MTNLIKLEGSEDSIVNSLLSADHSSDSQNPE